MKRQTFNKYLTAIIMIVVSVCFIPAYAFDTNANLALSKPATARDTWSGDGGIYAPSKAVDGSLSTSWMAAVDGPGIGSWLFVDLQDYYLINKVVIVWSNSRWPSGAWKLQVATAEPDASGNSNWADVYTGNAGSDVVSGTGTYIFTATAGRYVRMLGASQSMSYGYHIIEMSVFGSDYATPQGAATSLAISPSSKTLAVSQPYQFQSSIFAANGIPMSVSYTPTWSIQGSPAGASINGTSGLFCATQTGTYTVTCGTVYNSTAFNASATVTVNAFDTNQNLALNKTATTSGQTASNGNDGDLNTRWRSNAGNQQEWWQVDLGADYNVNNITIKMNGDAGARGATYNILASLTGLAGSWQTVVSSAQIPAGSGTEFNSHTITSVPAHYIKYDGLTRGGWDHNFAEFEVRGTGFYNPAPNLTFATPTSVTKNFGDAVFTNLASSSNSAGSISYSSGNTNVATVNSITSEVTIVAAGSAVITATIAANGTFSSTTATYTLIVNGIAPNLTFTTPVSITKNYGDIPFINSASSSNSSGAISYSSGNTSVATINSTTGEVTIVAAGSATITATITSYLSYTSTTASYTLTVNGISPALSFTTSGTINKKVGDATFTNIASSSNSNGTISYSSDNTSVVTVNSTSGLVTIIGAGTAIISATITPYVSYTARTVNYTVVVKYPVGSIKGTDIPLYAQGATGGDVNSPISASVEVIDYKIATENGKSWVYTKFTGTSAIDIGADWASQFRYWSAANAKTENWLTTSRNATTKVVTGKATTTIPNPLKISFFQVLISGGWSETLQANYNPGISNSTVNGDLSAPIISSCDIASTTTTAAITINGTDNSGDLFYQVVDAAHNIDEFTFDGTLNLTGLTNHTTYHLTITPYDFSGNQGVDFQKQFTCGQNIVVSTNSNISALASVDGNNVTVASGAELTVNTNTSIQDLIVAPGGKLTVGDGNILTTNTLNLNSDATGTATFVDNGTTNVTTANVQQYLTSGRNWYVSSPITGATTANLSTAGSIVYYDEPSATWKSPTTGATLNPMTGYISSATNGTGTITFSGALNTGNQSITLSRTNGVAKSGFNLVGNPYPSYVNWDLATKTDIQTTIWYRTKSSTAYVFDTYNGTSKVGTSLGLTTVSNLIPPMQAFWVRVAEGKTSGTLAFNNSMRLHNDISSNTMKAPSATKNNQQLLRLQVSNGTNNDESIVIFNPDASNGFDDFDSPKMTNASATIPEIYTMAGNQQLVINGLNSIAFYEELPLGFSTGQSNSFSIKATQIANFELDTKIVLRDKYSNSEVDITDGTAYRFTSDAVNSTSRFSLIFKTTSISTGFDRKNADIQSISIYKNASNQITITRAGVIDNDGIITVSNTIGQKVLSTLTTGTNTVLPNSFNPGVYLVSVTVDGKSITKKLIIN